jgi:glyoxylase-like metal-dependent hydrolase (beta-lactamase superfamily II)
MRSSEEVPVAEVDVLVAGYARRDGDVARVAGTVSLVRAEGLVAIVDPGMAADRELILRPLRELGIAPDHVTDVVLSHHHPDHTVNVALFPDARVHDTWAVYHRDEWRDRPAEGTELAPGVRLWETPGHTPQDVTTLVDTDGGTVALTHLWWHAMMEGDPRATDLDALHAGRARVLEVAARIVPGHGPAFDVDDRTPR